MLPLQTTSQAPRVYGSYPPHGSASGSVTYISKVWTKPETMEFGLPVVDLNPPPPMQPPAAWDSISPSVSAAAPQALVDAPVAPGPFP